MKMKITNKKAELIAHFTNLCRHSGSKDARIADIKREMSRPERGYRVSPRNWVVKKLGREDAIKIVRHLIVGYRLAGYLMEEVYAN